MHNKAIISSLVIAVLLIVAMGFLSRGQVGNPSQAQSGNHVLGNSASGNIQPAPDFSLESLNGEVLSVSQYKGDKPVILDFWATWCPNCQRDMPRLNGFYEKYKDQVEVIGVNLQESRGLVENFVSKRGITFPIVLDPRSDAARSYGVRYTNFHVLINKDGNVVRTIPGDIRESDILSLLN